MVLRLSVEFGPKEVWRPSFVVETPMLSRGTQIVSIGNFSGCDVISLTFARNSQPVNMAEYQIKVEYTGNQNAAEQKWISFVVAARSVNSGHYSFASLVEDIIRRCSSLNYLNEHSMRLRNLDDENNWINLNHGDDRGFIEFWQSATAFPEREVKRIKLSLFKYKCYTANV